MAKTGVLLINIGSTKSYQTKDVANYLRNFLMDKDVINLPWLFRWILVNLIIVPRRAKVSAENYKKVWLPEGSPLNVHSRVFAKGLQQELGADYLVEIGMRYSDPSIQKGLDRLRSRGATELIVVPLYPQYADATTTSSRLAAETALKNLGWKVPTRVYPAFFNSQAFVKTSAEVALLQTKDQNIDHFLFSFHGLPEDHVRKNQGCLESTTCCFEPWATQKNCYRAQCFATAKLIAEQMQIPSQKWSVSFQSRLGAGEWLKPATDDSIEILAATQKKNIAVLCPSFVADCIETIEEIGMGAKEHFIKNGGSIFTLIPCVNGDPAWTQGFANELKEYQQQQRN